MLNWQKALTNLICDWLGAKPKRKLRYGSASSGSGRSNFGLGFLKASEPELPLVLQPGFEPSTTDTRSKLCPLFCSLCWISVVTQSSENFLVAKKPLLIFSNLANSCFALFEQTLSSDWLTHFSLRSNERLQKRLNQATTCRLSPLVRFWTNLKIWSSTFNYLINRLFFSRWTIWLLLNSALRNIL